MTSSMYDAVIVGAGHNGLVCGAYLARKGMKVCVLEKRPIIGGAAVSEAVWPGYRVSVASYTMALLQPRIIEQLELGKYGFDVISPTPMVHFYGDGKTLVIQPDKPEFLSDVGRFHPDDAKAYVPYTEHMKGLGAIVREMLWEIPPDPASNTLSERARLLRFVLKFRNVGNGFYDLYDVLTLSARDFLARWFKSDEMITALGFYAGCGGATTSLCSPGSAYVLLRGYIRDHTTAAGPAGFVRGGMGSISEAIAASGQAHGMEVRCDVAVDRIVLRDGKATGVRLATGEILNAKLVVSNVASKVLFKQLLEPHAVAAEFLHRVDHIRDNSTAFKINLAMKTLPTFKDFNADAAGFDYPSQARFASSVNYLERAYDASKYGRIAERPALVMLTPSVLDPSVAPEGKHLISIFGQHAPYKLDGKNWDDARSELYETVLDTLVEHVPDIRECIDDAQVLSPADLERIFSLPGGHVHHGELSMDQIFFRRPVQGAANYRTPIANLYQCGASVHPGGGVTGVPGHNAAQVILKSHHV